MQDWSYETARAALGRATTIAECLAWIAKAKAVADGTTDEATLAIAKRIKHRGIRCCGLLLFRAPDVRTLSARQHAVARGYANLPERAFERAIETDDYAALAQLLEAYPPPAPEQTYDLYGGTPPHVDSDTSLGAAFAIESQADHLRATVLNYIAARGVLGATDEEVQIETGMNPNTERPRRRELEMMSLIADSGRRRLTRSGRQAVVWIVVAEASPTTTQELAPCGSKS